MMRCVFTIVLFVTLSRSFAKKVPDFIKTCNRNDPDFQECYKKSFNDVVKLLVEPRRDLNLRQIEPFHIETIDLSFGNGSSLAFDAKLQNLELLGLLETKCTDFSFDFDNLVYKVETFTPKLTMKSKYSAKGKVLLIQFDSSGNFTGDFGGVKGMVTSKGDTFTRKGKKYYTWKDHDLKVDIDSIKMYFGNLLPREDINESLNQAINENIQELYDELKPVINSIIKAIIGEQVDNFYRQFPADELFPL